MTMSEDKPKPKIPLWACEGKRKMTYWPEIIGVNI